MHTINDKCRLQCSFLLIYNYVDMALVEGFGDEVIQFFGILFVVVLIVLLWMSTQVAEMQIFRGAVFILERRTRRRHHDTARAAPVIPTPAISKYIIYYC